MVMVLVGRGSFVIMIAAAGVQVVELFLINVACAQKISRNASTLSSQTSAFVPQSALLCMQHHIPVMYETLKLKSYLLQNPRIKIPQASVIAKYTCTNHDRTKERAT